MGRASSRTANGFEAIFGKRRGSALAQAERDREEERQALRVNK
jgi:hypothetical protein